MYCIYLKKKKGTFHVTFYNQRSKRARSFSILFNYYFIAFCFHSKVKIKGEGRGRGGEKISFFLFQQRICTSFKLVTKVRKIILSMRVARPIFSGSFKIENNRKRKKFARIIPLVSVSKKVNKIMIRRMGTDSTCKCCHKTPTRDSGLVNFSQTF